MTAVHRRAARGEDRLAKALKTKRVKYRPRFASRPDVLPIRLQSGFVIQGESKCRTKLPKWLYLAIAEAEKYAERNRARLSLRKGERRGARCSAIA